MTSRDGEQAHAPTTDIADDVAPGTESRDRSQTSEDASERDWVPTGEAGSQGAGPEGAGPEVDVADSATPHLAQPETPVDRDPEGPGAVTPAEATDEDEDGVEPREQSGGGLLDGQLERRAVVRATGPPRRPPLIVQGLWPALLAGALALLASVGLLPLAAAVLVAQVFLILGALALLDAPAAGGAFVIATAATVAADALVLVDDGQVTGLAGAVGLGLVGSLIHQLVRKGRSRVTESLADTLVVIVVAVAAACLLALQQMRGGEQVLLVSLAATGAVLLTGRVGDRLAPRPMLAVGATRGWPGLLLGLGAGVSSALLLADADAGNELPLRSAALLGLVVAATVATADLAVDLGAAELRSGWRDARRVAALRPTALLLPYAVLGPVALVAGRLVLT